MGFTANDPPPMDMWRNKDPTGDTFFGVRIGHRKTAARLHGTTGGTRPPEPMQLDNTKTTENSIPPPGQRPNRSTQRYQNHP